MKTKKLLTGISLVLTLSLIAIYGGDAEAQSTPCEEKVTYQFDDGAWCDPAGNSCIVVWGCPEVE